MDYPAIECFRLYGLHGYKDVEIEFSDLNRIIMAENGSGKTTVLASLSAFLNGDFAGLQKLPFEKLECKFSNYEKTLRLEHTQIGAHYSNTEFADIADVLEVPLQEIRRLVTGSKSNDQVIEELWHLSSGSRQDVREVVTYIRGKIESSMPEEMKLVHQSVSEIMNDTNVLHLPTYRRIEAPLKKYVRKRNPAMRTKRFTSGDDSLPNSGVGVRYGLSDVEERLVQLVGEIQRLSNQGYRQISASIIDDLLAGGIDQNTGQVLPSIDSLRLFFSRVDQNTSSESRTERLSELYEMGGIDTGDNVPLKYFLSKLAVVIGETEELESNIERFVEQVNIYLNMSSDEKVLRYNPSEMKVQVINTWTESIVQMNDLSSGEKQVISLFSYLYLYPNKNIVLIDEPELSLSIEWQQRLLVDVIGSPTCVQLLAITHSPFIFDNELDPIAGPMSVNRTKRAYR